MKAIKWIAGIIGVLVIIAIGATVYRYVSGIDPEKEARDNLFRSRRTEGKLLAITLYTQMVMSQVERTQYPTWEELQEDLEEAEFLLSDYQFYRFGIPEFDKNLKKLCPDCHMSETSFKMAVYGDIDEDGEDDVMTIDQDKKLILIQDDIGEAQVPLDIGSAK